MYNWNYFENIPNQHIISDGNSLLKAYKAAKKNSGWKPQVQKFEWNNLIENRKLQIELNNLQYDKKNSYKTSQYSEFFVNERGKVRPITGLQIQDRVVRHTLNDEVLLKYIRPHLIYDNGASLKGKGIDFCRNRLITHLKRFYGKYHTNDGYIMILDFSKFYDNIDHYKALQLICKYIKDEFTLKLTKEIFKTFEVDVSYLSNEEYCNIEKWKYDSVQYRLLNPIKTGEKIIKRSVSVGDQTSQIIAVAFPTLLDNFITKVKGYGLYARYMDDLYIIAKTKQELINLLKEIKLQCKNLNIFLNDKKTKIIKLSNTFRFLQNRYFLTDNGFVVIRINQKSITRIRRRLKKIKRKMLNNEISLEQISNMFKSWISARIKIMSNKQKENMIKLYQELYGNNIDEWLISKQLI